jgi:hypothetical protein
VQGVLPARSLRVSLKYYLLYPPSFSRKGDGLQEAIEKPLTISYNPYVGEEDLC